MQYFSEQLPKDKASDLGHKEEFIYQFRTFSSLKCVMFGFFDINTRSFTKVWSSLAEDVSDEAYQDLIGAALRRLSVFLTAYGPEQTTESAAANESKPSGHLVWANSGRHVIGVGRALANVVPVMGFPKDNRGLAAELVLLKLGLSHVSQKLRLALYSQPVWSDVLVSSTLKMFSIEFFLVSADGKILQDGRTENDANIGWTIVGGRLALNRASESAMLREAIYKAASDTREASILTYSDRSGAKKMAAIAPAGPENQGMALVLFEDPNADQFALREHFCRAHGLTTSEMQIAKEVLDGKSLTDVAEATKYSLSTVRSYMKQVFSKTETHRQSELIALYYKSILPVGKSIAAASRPKAN